MQLGMVGLGRMGAHMTSGGDADYQDKLLSAMRYEFAGHLEKSGGKQAARAEAR